MCLSDKGGKQWCREPKNYSTSLEARKHKTSRDMSVLSSMYSSWGLISVKPDKWLENSRAKSKAQDFLQARWGFWSHRMIMQVFSWQACAVFVIPGISFSTPSISSSPGVFLYDAPPAWASDCTDAMWFCSMLHAPSEALLRPPVSSDWVYLLIWFPWVQSFYFG